MMRPSRLTTSDCRLLVLPISCTSKRSPGPTTYSDGTGMSLTGRKRRRHAGEQVVPERLERLDVELLERQQRQLRLESGQRRITVQACARLLFREAGQWNRRDARQPQDTADVELVGIASQRRGRASPAVAPCLPRCVRLVFRERLLGFSERSSSSTVSPRPARCRSRGSWVRAVDFAVLSGMRSSCSVPRPRPRLPSLRRSRTHRFGSQ